jgi:hypothetical protein
MSCIGFNCFQIGIIHISILRESEETCKLFEHPGAEYHVSPYLETLGPLVAIDPQSGQISNSHFTNVAMQINDDEYMTHD